MTFLSAAAVMALGSGSASASVPPPPESDQCAGWVTNVHRVDSAHVSATYVMECSDEVSPIVMSVAGAISRSGYTREPNAHDCYRVRTCSETVVASDPSGTQTYYFDWDPDSYVGFASGSKFGAEWKCLSPGIDPHMTCTNTTGKY